MRRPKASWRVFQHFGLSTRRGILAVVLGCLILGVGLAQIPQTSTQNSATDITKPDIEAQDRWAGRSDFWRQVRDGMRGSINLPSKEKGVLIQSRGRDWGQVHGDLVLGYGVKVLTAVFVLILAVLIVQGHLKALVQPVMGVARRFNTMDRLAHWLSGGAFIILGVTGLNVLYGKTLIMPLIGKVNFAALAAIGKVTHNLAAWAFILGIILLVFVWVRDHMPRSARVRMFKKTGVDRQVEKAIAVNRFSTGEKMVFWLVIGGGAIVAYSGLSLLFPLSFADLGQMQFLQVAHSVSSLTLAALIFGHIFIVTTGVRENAKKLAEAKDILEKRVMERTDQLEKVNSQLLREIEERREIETALQIAKTEAEEANKSKDRFLATASHDLLQPLSAARLMVATLRERQLREANRELVNHIHLALRGAEDLLADQLDIAKFDADAVTPRIIDVSVKQILSAIEMEYSPLARQAGLELRVRPGDGVVRTDPHLLTRVLRNFVSNAIRYTDRGGVMIGCRNREGVLRFEVWDTGVGISEAHLTAIFEEFHQVGNEVRENDKGAGLGLAIVDRIARMLDLPVTVRSREGRGSVFSIDVPVGDALPQAEIVSTIVAGDDGLAGKTILAIDNDPKILIGMTLLLEEWHCTVLLANSVDEATSLIAKVEAVPDLIIADYHLDNDQVGSDVVKAVRDILGREVPAFIVTADRTPGQKQALEDAGFPVLYKPLRPGKMRALMSHLLAEKSIREAS